MSIKRHRSTEMPSEAASGLQGTNPSLGSENSMVQDLLREQGSTVAPTVDPTDLDHDGVPGWKDVGKRVSPSGGKSKKG